jgi:tetratricopeptide (TPR) repeat protein
MPWCAICRREYSGNEGTPCPKCGTIGTAQEQSDSPAASSASQPAHLAILEAQNASAQAQGDGAQEALNQLPPKRRLISTAGPAVPIRKSVTDSVPSSWMSRLEAARVVTTNPSEANEVTEPKVPRSGSQPPPLKPKTDKGDKNGGEKKTAAAPVGKPAHLLIAQLEAEDQKRSDIEAARVAQLFEGDKSDEIAKVEIALSTDEVKKKKIPDWVIVTVLVVLVIAAVGIAVVMTQKKQGPVAEIDPAVRAAAEKKKQAIVALEEGHRLALEGKAKADEALKAYGHALELDPTLASAERGLAIAHASKDDVEQAVEHYEKYLKLAPNATDAADVRKILENYRKIRDKKEAEKKAAEEAAKAEAAKAAAKSHPKKNGHKHHP